MLGEAARRRVRRRVTFGRVLRDRRRSLPAGTLGEAGEVRIVGAPRPIDELCDACVQAAARLRGGSAAHRLLAGRPARALSAAIIWRWRRCARAAAADGLEAPSAEVPLDRLATRRYARGRARGRHGGLAVWRAHGRPSRALDSGSISSSARSTVQAETRRVRAFAPLPRLDPADAPSTGYDDVRTVAVARLHVRDDPVHSGGLAAVRPEARAGGDRVRRRTTSTASPPSIRRTSGRAGRPKEDIERQIRAAACDAGRAQRPLRAPVVSRRSGWARSAI